MCFLTVLARFGHRKWPNFAKMSKNSGFSKHEHIRDSKYPLESGGGWGLFVFHKYMYFLVLFNIHLYVYVYLLQLLNTLAMQRNIYKNTTFHNMMGIISFLYFRYSLFTCFFVWMIKTYILVFYTDRIIQYIFLFHLKCQLLYQLFLLHKRLNFSKCFYEYMYGI